MTTEIARDQFNRQAENFARFELTRNETIFQFLIDFCGFKKSDTLLDVASGSGAFINYCSKELNHVFGVDISNELIKLAKKDATTSGRINASFICCDVENLPISNDSFDVVTCRSALHHMDHPEIVLSEMVRVANPCGKICIQDMTSYKDPYVNEFFERMEKYIDISHFRALSTEEIKNQLIDNNVTVENSYETTLTHNLTEYIGHAHQTPELKGRLFDHITSGLKHKALSEFIFEGEQGFCFKRSGIVIYGKI